MTAKPVAPECRVELNCRACGKPFEAPFSRLEGQTAAPCPDPACAGAAALPVDFADTVRFVLEETRRRLQAAG